jgi:hypothetical protein
VLRATLLGLSSHWLDASEGPNTWTPRQVLAHMLGAERSAWIRRVRHILEHGEDRAFEPFDRTSEFETAATRPVTELLDEFEHLRRENLQSLAALRLTPEQLEQTSLHPQFGPVRMRELLATWVAHDLSHIAQINRVFAKRYLADVGPWRVNLRLLRDAMDAPAQTPE